MPDSSAVTKNVLVRMLITSLPARMKRLVYLSSLAGIARGSHVPEKHFISKLNRMLNLCTTGDSSMKLPIQVSRLIWEDKTVFKDELQQLMEQDSDAGEPLAQRIAAATPAWLQYADGSFVVRDILQLFSNENRLFPSSPAGA